MSRRRLASMMGAAILLAGLPGPIHAGEELAAKPPTLYQRMGGYDTLAAIFDDFAPRLVADPQFSRFFAGHATDSDLRQRQRVVERLCQDSGGPCVYIGRPLRAAHGGLGVTATQWSAFVKHLAATLDHLKVAEKEKAEFLAMVSGYASEVVDKP